MDKQCAKHPCMKDANQSAEPLTTASETGSTLPGPGRCLIGSVVAGAIAFVLYLLTTAIAQTFAAKGLQTDNLTAQRIAVAVRTLVVGLSALGTGIFGMAAIGLFGLALQILLRREPSTPPSKS